MPAVASMVGGGPDLVPAHRLAGSADRRLVDVEALDDRISERLRIGPLLDVVLHRTQEPSLAGPVEPKHVAAPGCDDRATPCHPKRQIQAIPPPDSGRIVHELGAQEVEGTNPERSKNRIGVLEIVPVPIVEGDEDGRPGRAHGSRHAGTQVLWSDDVAVRTEPAHLGRKSPDVEVGKRIARLPDAVIEEDDAARFDGAACQAPDGAGGERRLDDAFERGERSHPG